jgi:fumarate reductase subunit C
MLTTVFFPLSPAIKSVTIIASIIILVTMGYMAYQWYITDPKEVCIITRKSKMPIVVSIADNSVFNAISKVQEKN